MNDLTFGVKQLNNGPQKLLLPDKDRYKLIVTKYFTDYFTK
jgi:hypothetical protein